MNQPLPHELAMVHAKIAFMNDEKSMFLYNVCFHLKFVWDAGINPPTACVDGYTMTFHPDFFMMLPHEMRITLLAHETGHVTKEHMARRAGREPREYNHAADYVINQELKDAGFKPIIWKDDNGKEIKWLQDDRFANMTTEQVYDILISERQPPPEAGGGSGGIPDPNGQSTDGASGGAGMPGGDDPWRDIREPQNAKDEPGKPPTPKPTEAEVRQHLDEILISSAMAARLGGQPGSIPNDVQMYLDSLLKPKLPMASHLRRFFQATQKNDYTWQRPNRRHLPMYLPSMRSEALSHIAFAFDMSASVRDSDIKRYVSEMVGVLRNMKPDKITLILFDTAIKSITEVKSVKDLMEVKLIGRGGTDVGELLEWARKNNPKALCIFTDGEFHDFGFRKPACPILWMIHNKRRKFSWNYGTVIPFEV